MSSADLCISLPSPSHPTSPHIANILPRTLSQTAVSVPQSISASSSPADDSSRSSSEQYGSSSPSLTSSQSLSSSPDLRAFDLHTPIPEEDEDETSSEAANEPVTPTDGQSSHNFHHSSKDAGHNDTTAYTPMNTKTPMLIQTNSTPPQGALHSNGGTTPVAVDNTPPQTPLQSRPPSSRAASHKRSMNSFSNLFGLKNRAHSSSWGPSAFEAAYEESVGVANNASEVMLPGRRYDSYIRRHSETTSANTTRSSTPPSPGHASPRQPQARVNFPSQPKVKRQEPEKDGFFGSTKKKSTTFNFRQKLFRSHEKAADPSLHRHRASSVDLHAGSTPTEKAEGTVLTDLERLPWSLAAEAGTGVKARRMSLSLPDDFTVDFVELHKDFSDQSKRFGKRGRTVGKGATSQVMLMSRKGYPNELFAVKEFRKKGSNEDAEDYEKKVKSEYSIAKSLHHPNIVETIRLCTHQGRWEHVMEWCSEGDLFSLVQKGYLKKEDRLTDRLCLFKQLVQGVQYLHSNGIAHRDIKLENLLITNGSKLKITDFGVSEVFCGMHPGLRAAGGVCGKDMNEVRLCAPGICGSMPYIAPEVIDKHGEYDPRPLDVWSSAVVMLHLVFGGALWTRAETDKGNANYDELIRGWAKWNAKHSDGETISETDYPHVKAFDALVNPPALRRLLLGMLNPKASKRTTMADVVNNRWMKHVECCQVDSFEDPSRVIDASKKGGLCSSKAIKVAVHNHLPEKSKSLNAIIRLPGSTDLDY